MACQSLTHAGLSPAAWSFGPPSSLLHYFTTYTVGKYSITDLLALKFNLYVFMLWRVIFDIGIPGNGYITVMNISSHILDS